MENDSEPGNTADTMIAPTSGQLDPDQTADVNLHPTTSISSSLTSPRKRIGRFKIMEVIGHGSFGIVYHAFDPILDREVALKVPLVAESTLESQERFTREAKSAARLRHPNIVTVYESGSADGASYIATEFVKGVTLSHVMRTREIDIRTSVDWVRQIAEAMHYAHHEGVVHRDVKPSNIMLNAADRPQVMDFGLAKRIADEASNMTIEGQVLGTPAYMSPEQARGEMHSVGPLSDQYSVGVVLYELLCRQKMFNGPAWSVMSRIGNPNDCAPPPRSIRAEIPRDLEACCLKATDKIASARYRDLGELAEDLERWLEGRPVLARPIGYWERLRRWTRQNPVITALASLLLLLLVVATIVSLMAAVSFRELARSESESKTNLERVLIDTYAEAGLSAAERNEADQAILWFANAIDLAADHPSRRQWNTIRLESWLAEVAIPFRAFERPGYWCEAIEYHPSSRYLLVESMADSVEIHELSTGQTLPLPCDAPIADAVWNREGTMLAVASNWDVVVVTFPDYEPVASWTHYDPVQSLAFSHDSELLAVGGQASLEICRLNASVPTECAMVHTGPIKSMRFSNDDAVIAVATDDQHVQPYKLTEDLSSLDPVSTPLPSRTELAEAKYGFTADNHLVVADGNNAISCWNLVEHSTVWEHPVGRIFDLGVSPDGARIAYSEISTTGLYQASILQAVDGSEASAVITHQNHILDVDWHPTGELLLTSSADHTAAISTTATGEGELPAIPHSGFVLRGVWSLDGRTFATCLRDDPLVQVWKMPEQGARDFEFATGGDRPFFIVRPAETGHVIIPTGFDTRRDGTGISMHDAGTGDRIGAEVNCRGLYSDSECLSERDLLITLSSQETSFPSTVIYEQDLSQPGVIQFWSATTGASVLPDVETDSEPIGIAATTDGKRVGVVCQSGEFLLLDCETGDVLSRHPSIAGQAADVGFVIRDRIRCSPEGSRFATWGFGSHVELWDAATGQPVFQAQHEGDFVHDLQFSPDCEVFATCSEDGTVSVWDADDGEQLASLEHAGWVLCVRFSDDGRFLLTGSEDRQARIWDWRRQSVVCSTPELSDQVYAVSFIAPGQFVVGTLSGELTAWESETGKLIAPPREFGGAIYQLDLQNDVLLVSGRFPTLHGLEVRDWIRIPDDSLDANELQLLVELVATQRIPETGTPTGLTTGEWLDRWQTLQERYPQSSLFDMPREYVK